MSIQWKAVPLALLICGAEALAAHAGLTICNRSPKDAWVAVQVQDRQCPSLARRKGWWKLRACGGCQVVESANLQQGAPYYVYAVGVDGKEWKGTSKSCTPRRGFDSCIPRTENSCGEASPSRGYREYTASGRDLTVNLKRHRSDTATCID